MNNVFAAFAVLCATAIIASLIALVLPTPKKCLSFHAEISRNLSYYGNYQGQTANLICDQYAP